MANPFNGSAHGKRDGSVYRASKTADRVLDMRPAATRKAHPLYQPDSAPSTWTATESAGLAWQCNQEIEETRETHGDIRRRSLTESAHLEQRTEQLDFGVRRERRIVRRWNGYKAEWEPVFNADGSPCWVKGMPEAEGWIENPRLLWKSDKTLLRQGHPDQAPKDIKRIDPYTKQIIRDEQERSAVEEVPIMDNLEIDRLNLDYNDL